MAAGLPRELVESNFSAWVSDMAERQFCSQDCVYPCNRPSLMLSMGYGGNRHLIPESNTEDERCKRFTLSLSKLLSSTIKHRFFLLFLPYLQLIFSSHSPLYKSFLSFSLYFIILFFPHISLSFSCLFSILYYLSLPPDSPVSEYVLCLHQFP